MYFGWSTRSTIIRMSRVSVAIGAPPQRTLSLAEVAILLAAPDHREPERPMHGDLALVGVGGYTGQIRKARAILEDFDPLTDVVPVADEVPHAEQVRAPAVASEASSDE